MGTRGSKLALAQTGEICACLQKKFPQLHIQIQTLTTSGDKYQGERLADAGGKALFVKEIEEALLNNTIDMAVHSLKDLPGFLPEGLEIACTPKREDPRDAFVSKEFPSLEDLPKGAVVGTGSPRRTAQLLNMRPDLKIKPIRGNVDTRLEKLSQGLYDALILAAAGLKRLQKEKVIRQYLNPDFFVPSVGQGILGLEVRSKDQEFSEWLREALNDEAAGLAARAERSFLQAFGGDCYTPLGGYALVEGSQLKMRGFFSNPDGTKAEWVSLSGPKESPEELGERLEHEISRHKTS